MKPRPAEPTAVFHEREAMEDAVRALVAKGIRRQRIRISRGRIGDDGDVIHTRECSSLLGLGLGLGALAGATQTLIWILLITGSAAVPFSLIALRTATGAASGALLGVVLTILIATAHRKAHPPCKPGDFIVTVKRPNAREAEDVRSLLAQGGGELVPA